MAQALPSGRKDNFFSNKTIWITGASSGIGEQLAYDLSDFGATLILSARRVAVLEAVKNKCKGASNKIHIVPLDLAQHDNLFVVAQEVIEKHGKIDILINNGGISQRAFTIDTSFDVDKRIMDVNYFGTIALTKAILPNMIQHQHGQILTITSVAGKIGVPGRTSYSASKHAVHGFMDALRAEVAAHDINVINVCPGYVKTNISQNALTGEGFSNKKTDKNIENGMAVEYISNRVLNALRKRREEVYIGKREVMGIYVMRLFPKLFFRIAKGLAK
ncbi:MAG: SDR family oxidoreductase [Saprospiraceae bacterium]|mgnify:CR=1 FL=1